MDENERQDFESEESFEEQFESAPEQAPEGGSNNTVAVVAVVILLGILAYGLYVFLNQEPTTPDLVPPVDQEEAVENDEGLNIIDEDQDIELIEEEVPADVETDSDVEAEAEAEAGLEAEEVLE